MFVVVNKYILAKRFDGIVLWPFIFVKRQALKRNPVFMNHERIHIKQQLELFVILFFLFYIVEYIVRLLQYRDSRKAYHHISFEKEAYVNEEDLDYIQNRSFWAFLKYL